MLVRAAPRQAAVSKDTNIAPWAQAHCVARTAQRHDNNANSTSYMQKKPENFKAEGKGTGYSFTKLYE
jgi:hypothetical protein